MACRIGRPAVPPGSPSSWKRYGAPKRQAQQLCVAWGSREASRKDWAASGASMGAARARKRLLRISASCRAAAVSVCGMPASPMRMTAGLGLDALGLEVFLVGARIIVQAAIGQDLDHPRRHARHELAVVRDEHQRALVLFQRVLQG